MKKLKKKFLAVNLLILMLLNVILPVVQAVPTEPTKILEEENVDKSDGYAIYALEYEAYNSNEFKANPTTAISKKTYAAGDIVKLKVVIKETDTNWTGLSQFQADMWYDINILEPISKNNPDYDDFNYPKNYVEWYDNSLEDGYITVNCPSTSKCNLKAGNWIMEMFFVAKADSNTETSVIVYNIKSDGIGSGDAYTVFGNANTPILTLPEPAEPVEIKTHGIEITKVNEEGTAITSGEAIYKITPPQGESKFIITNNNGKGILENLSMSLGSDATQEYSNYIIEEIQAPEGYQIDSTKKTLSVKFDQTTGQITEVKLDGVEQVAPEDNIIKLQFENVLKQEEPDPIPESEVTFIINKKDEDGNLITTSSSSFTLEVYEGDVKYLTTNAGTITTSVKVPEDISVPVLYKLNEVVAPDGYILDGQDINISVSFTKNEDNTISIASVSKNSKANATLSYTGNTITINVTNEKQKEQEKFQIELTKVDTNEVPITTGSAVFMVIAPDGTKLLATTDETTGKVVIDGNIPMGELLEEGYTYRIQEFKAPAGYKTDSSEINVKLTFKDEAGRRKLSSATVTGGNVTKGTIQNNVLPLSIVNEQEAGDFTITLNKVDENGNKILAPNVIFTLTNEKGESVTLKTDATGKAIYTGKIPDVAGEKQYILTEIIAPNGYILNNDEQIIKLNFTKETGIMMLTSATVEDPISKVGDITNNNLEINFKNEMQIPVEESEYFNISVTKVEKETKTPITSDTAIFQLLNEDNTSVGLFETNANGIATLQVNMPNEAGTINYKLVEIKAPAGYEKDETKKDISITFTNDAGIMQVQSINVTGENVTNGGTTVATASMLFENKLIPPETQPKNYELVINKKDAEDLTTNITTGSAIFVVTGPDGLLRTLKTDALGKISIVGNVPEVAGTHTYEIQEVKAPQGYIVFDTPQYIDITFGGDNGNIQIISATVRGDKIKKDFAGVNEEGKSQVVVSIFNEKQVTDVEKDTFNLVINKVDSETLENILEAKVTFKIVNSENSSFYVETLQTGIATLKLPVPETAGTYRYKLNEISAPKDYDKNENELYVDVTFTQGEEKLEITKLVVNEEKGIKAVKFEENMVEVKVLNSKTKDDPKDPEDPNEPDKPDDPNKPEEKVFDLKLDKYITSITTKYDDTNEVTKRAVTKKDGISKIDIKANRLKHLILKIEYKIVVTNVGNKEGTLNAILDRIPSGLTMDIKENKGWSLNNNIATYSEQNTVLKPGESKEVTIVLNCSGKTASTGEIINYASFEAVDEKDGDKPTNSNNIGNATFILSVKTGQEWVIYPVITLVSLAIIAIGVVGIKKYVL